MEFVETGEESLSHYGTPRRSGRYPWGSGEEPYQSSSSFLGEIEKLRATGMSDTDISRAMGFTTTEYRAFRAIARNEKKAADIAMAQRLKDKGYSNVAIGERMGINESSVRSLLAPGASQTNDIRVSTLDTLKKQVDEKGYIDVGTDVERYMGVSRYNLDVALKMAEVEGYSLETVRVTQVGTGEPTTIKVLAKPGTTQKDIFLNRDKITQIEEFSEDGGRTYISLKPPKSIDSKRVQVVYGDEGGSDADGTIYVRPGVKDISLGGASYAQVRVAVDGTHYLKGMAIYKDDLPDGVDLVFNTNKKSTGDPHDAMKKISDDPENPFGSQIKRQIFDSTNKEKPTSVMNIVNEEGDWDTWSRNLSSQMLSKQPLGLVKEQLGAAYSSKKTQLDEILALTNPVVKKKLLSSYADDVDAASVALKAAALPRQSTKVIIPVPQLKDNEVYAPTYRDGETLVLIRHPHGGIFEIPTLTVNNRNPHGKKMLGQAKDAIGINAKVAERLSGADFDGDHVLAIPNDHGKVRTSPQLEGLKDFDPKKSYPKYEGMKVMTEKQKGAEMGKISNLITDMQIKGANTTEIAAAVRHSMVVIDAAKHELNYVQSARDNGIAALERKYQMKENGRAGGASTLISRASSPRFIEERKPRSALKGGPIDKETGELAWEPTGRTKIGKDGKETLRKQKVDNLAITKDARELSSGSPVEEVYATHSNRLKALANEARKAMVNTENIPYSPEAKVTYAKEVASLNSALNVALKNKPRERQAQVLANAIVATKRRANPGMDADAVKKLKTRALVQARAKTGADKHTIEITKDQWIAIQAGALSTNKLTKILDNADLESVKRLATPRKENVMSTSRINRAKGMLARGYTQAEVAEALGVSVSTINDIL